MSTCTPSPQGVVSKDVPGKLGEQKKNGCEPFGSQPIVSCNSCRDYLLGLCSLWHALQLAAFFSMAGAFSSPSTNALPALSNARVFFFQL